MLLHLALEDAVLGGDAEGGFDLLGSLFGLFGRPLVGFWTFFDLARFVIGVP